MRNRRVAWKRGRRKADVARGDVMVHDEGSESLDVVVLPVSRHVRSSEYRGAFWWMEEGRAWARESPDLVELVKRDRRLRVHVVGRMRNAAWWLRNHRVCEARGVLERLREYGADEELLILAGVHPLVCAVLWEFFFTDCGCKGACASIDFDPLEIPTHARLCDALFRAVREHVLVADA